VPFGVGLLLSVAVPLVVPLAFPAVRAEFLPAARATFQLASSLPRALFPEGISRIPAAPYAAVSVASEGEAPVAAPLERIAPTAVASLGANLGAPSPDPVKPDLANPEPADPERLEAEKFLGIVGKQTEILVEPQPGARVFGWARTGALLRRAAEPVTKRGCADGWFRVEPEGYVCAGSKATLDLEHIALRAASREPDRSAILPYAYGQSRSPSPPFYRRLPSKPEQAQIELDLTRHATRALGAAWTEEAAGPPPAFLAQGAALPRLPGYARVGDQVSSGRAGARSAFAFLDLFDLDGRKFGLTTDLSLLPLDRVTKVEPSEFSGVTLSEQMSLPLAFARSHSAWVYDLEPSGRGLVPVRLAKYREAFALSGERRNFGGVRLVGTRGGNWLRESPTLVELPVAERLPKWAGRDTTWLSVSVLKQSLVVYRGDKPVYATLVSTGVDGLGDPLETHSTVLGVYRIHTKHVTATMSGDEVDDAFDLRDIPYVQYFHEGYALHAAFWHDGFGQPKSHGCINLSPRDARILFHMTEPAVPNHWHGALSRAGSIIYIHR